MAPDCAGATGVPGYIRPRTPTSLKIVQTDGDEVAQHGTLDIVILESINRHRNLVH